MTQEEGIVVLLLKRNALLVVVLCLVVLLFFQTTKHQPSLAAINPFAEDPYDSVSSFGVQFLIFIAVVCVIRAFRPYCSPTASEARQAILVRAMLMGLMAALTISISNSVALVRHRPQWVGVPGGRDLLTLTVGLFTITVLIGAFLLFSVQSSILALQNVRWSRPAWALSMVGLILLFYPEHLRTNLAGELMTVLTGAALLFLPVWALAEATGSPDELAMDDLIGDMTAIYAVCKRATPSLLSLWARLEKLVALPSAAWLIALLNPRRHRWNIVVFLGVVIGMAFLAAEAIVDGPPSAWEKLLILAAVFIGLQMAGVALGYALLAKPLHLVQERKSVH